MANKLTDKKLDKLCRDKNPVIADLAKRLATKRLYVEMMKAKIREAIGSPSKWRAQ